jgi:vitamin B12 transporter
MTRLSRFPIFTVSPIAALMLGTAPMTAQAQVMDLDEITVLAGQSDTELSRTGASVEVLGQREIDDGQIDTANTLSLLPGVTLSRNGGIGATTTLRIRGLGSKYIAVRIDGIDVSDPSSTQTAFDFGGLINAGLGRIELLKGSQSAIHGSEAVGGVIDIASRRPEKLGFSGRITAEAGRYGTALGALTLSNATEDGEVTLSMSRVVTDGFSNRDSDTEKDGLEQTDLRLNARHAVTDRLTLGFAALYSDGTTQFDRSATDPSGDIDQTRRGARVFAEYAGDRIDHEFSIQRFENDRLDAGSPFTNRFLGQRTKADYTGHTALGARTDLSFGAEWTEESARLDATRTETSEVAGFAELSYAPRDDFDLSLALRRDEHEDFGGRTSGRAALAWRFADDMTLRAVAGTGFRAPSLYELFGPFGNPNLDAETSESYELSLEKRFAGDAMIKATLFHTEIDNLIDYSFATSSYAQVPGVTRTRGLELAARAPLGGAVDLYGSYTLSDTRTPGGGRLARTPRHDLTVGVSGQTDWGLRGDIAVNHVADRPDDGFPSQAMADYTLVHLGAAYAVTDSAEVYLRVENLTDADYQTAAGFNQSGRAAYFGLRASF